MHKHCMLRYKTGRLMFMTDPNPDGGGSTTPPADPPTPNDDLGFPANTPTADMDDAQKAAYWRHEAKKQQKIADGRKDYDTLKQERDDLVNKHATEDDRKLADAKTAGANEATSRLLTTAVRGHLRALTKRSVEDIDSALEFVDIGKFATADGDLDDDKLDAFAKTLGTGASEESTPPADPVRDALERQQRGNPNEQQGGSIAAQEAREYDRLTGKK